MHFDLQAGLAEERGLVAELFQIAAGDDGSRPGLGQRLGDLPAEQSRPAGDDGHAAFQIEQLLNGSHFFRHIDSPCLFPTVIASSLENGHDVLRRRVALNLVGGRNDVTRRAVPRCQSSAWSRVNLFRRGVRQQTDLVDLRR